MSGPITDPQGIARAVLRWIELARKSGYLKPDQLPGAADVDHSSLLRRLLDGKAPLLHPPPRAFSYPWYEAVEASPVTIGPDTENWRPSFGNAMKPRSLVAPHQVLIHQGIYNIVGTLPGGEWLIADAGHVTPYRWRLWLDRPEGAPPVWRMALVASDT